MKVLDYGAGKFGRNAEYLKSIGCKVYAYDPYNGDDSDGWRGVSTTLPDDKDFDVGFSSFVLNVVPDEIENQIIKEMDTYCDSNLHITRNMDIYDTIKSALERKDKLVVDFFENEYANDELIKRLHDDELTKEEIVNFCIFGTVTSKGFQRIPDLTHKGFEVIRNTYKFKIFKK